MTKIRGVFGKLRNALACSVASFALFETSSAYAADAEFCTSATTLVAFTNGVWNNYEDAKASMDIIKPFVQSRLTAAEFEKTQFEIRHNSSGCSRYAIANWLTAGVGCIVDVIETFLQKAVIGSTALGLDTAATVRLYWMFASNLADNAISARLGLTAEQISTARAQYVAALAEVETASRTLVNQNGDAAFYDSEIGRGKRIIVIAHSQGNIFANSAYSQLAADKRQHMRVIGVATPDSAHPGGPYTTLSGDKVIALVPGALPANLTSSCAIFSSCHGIVTDYLAAGSAPRGAIEANIASALTSLASPTSQYGDGAIVVTTTWNSEPDVDTHIFEPGGAHVYWASQAGVAGALDRDDVDGFGPENYRVPCATLKTGTYNVGLNYYDGQGAAPTKVDIRAGTIARTFPKTLTNVRGSAGDNSPEPVATITVGGTAPNYTFTIQ